MSEATLYCEACERDIAHDCRQGGTRPDFFCSSCSAKDAEIERLGKRAERLETAASLANQARLEFVEALGETEDEAVELEATIERLRKARETTKEAWGNHWPDCEKRRATLDAVREWAEHDQPDGHRYCPKCQVLNIITKDERTDSVEALDAPPKKS